MVVSGGSGGDMQAQIRQRMLERYQQDFAAFRTSLDEAQRKQWDAAVSALTSAKRAPLYKLVNGKPQQVQVRIGASDGTNTEVSGDIKQGDQIITGERVTE
jgi:HlyD family secretion protein